MVNIIDIFKQDGPLSNCIEQFEPRQAQVKMAQAVAELLIQTEDDVEQQSHVLVVEAETGIGKTIAYLIPAVLSAKRIVVSTATLNLQDQIIKKDIPLLEEVLEQSISALAVKGRENYLCLYRWYQYRSNPQLSIIEDPWVEKIDDWLDHTESGDRAELDWLQDKSRIWSKISSVSSQCLGGECPESSLCFINRLRIKAGSARLLIVNHHLFFSDLALKKGGYGELLPRYEAVVFDEAHHLENTASIFFGKSFSQYQLIDFLADVERQAEADLPPDQIDRVFSSCNGLRQRVKTFYHSFPTKFGKFHINGLIEEIGEDQWQEQISLLSEGIKRFLADLDQLMAYGEIWKHLSERGKELNDNLCDIALISEEESYNFVHWFEKKERSVAISATPIDISQILNDHLYTKVRACILTSATLTTGNSFAYVSERLGLDDRTQFLQLASPFDYANRTLLYIPDVSFPEPNSPEFQKAVNEHVLDILRVSKGRALVLCTSLRGMHSIADYVSDLLHHKVLVQGSASKNGLLETFREQTDSVLFAVASFWEGVDIVGESLSCVIIDKLPFEVPSDPVVQARIEQIKQNGGKPFFEFQVPRAILTLRQGVGRLIRSAKDSGIIAIMDVRLLKKGYGKKFLNSLPPSPRQHRLSDIESFYQEVDKQ